MATIRKEITTTASVDQVWAAIRDIGGLHTRLVPGFVVDTRLEPGARIVTFANGITVRELIVSVDDEDMRLVWSTISERLTHHNASVQVLANPEGVTKIVWIADLLPDETASLINQMMDQGMMAMKTALDDHSSKAITGTDRS